MSRSSNYDEQIKKLYRRYSKWEIVAQVTVKFFGSSSYSYYFSVVAETTMVADAIMDVANPIYLKLRKDQSIL